MRRILNACRAALGRVHLLRRLSYALHGFLFGLHLVLAILHLCPIEGLVTFPLDEDDDPSDTSLAVAVTVSGTIFATVYGALLIWITQKLALRRLLTSRQTLTAMHDEFNAWIGIGSAMSTLYGQCRIRSALPWVLCIAGYLINITVLHISIPSMLSLPIGDKDFIDAITTQLAYPDVDGMLYNAQSNSDGAPNLFHALFTDASSLLPYIVLASARESPGLSRATIYDIPVVAAGPESNSTALANATTFAVSCAELDRLQLEDFYPQDAREIWHYNVSHARPDGARQRHIRLKHILPNNAMGLAWANVSGHDARPAANRSFYAYGTFDIEDSAHTLLPSFTLPRRVAAGAPLNMPVVGCALASSHGLVHVNTSTRLVVPGGVARLPDFALWEPWEAPEAVAAEDLKITDLWTTAMMKQYETNLGLGAANVYNLGFMEKYVLTRMNLTVPSYTDERVPRGRVKLYELNNALSELVAAYFWSRAPNVNQVNTNNQYGIERTSVAATFIPQPVRKLHVRKVHSYSPTLSHPTSYCPIPSDHTHLQLNRGSIFLGLASSLVLLLLNTLLIRPRGSRARGAVDVLDSLGLLQAVWFVRARPDVLDTVGRVRSPEEERLRRAGMFVLEPDVRASVRGGGPVLGAGLDPAPGAQGWGPMRVAAGGDPAPIPLSLIPSETPVTDKWRETEWERGRRTEWERERRGSDDSEIPDVPSHWERFESGR
ncbi:hypothetical protein HDZ31DRAFT_80676 [Schizophyllum fasciatum]